MDKPIFETKVGKCPTCGADALDRSEFWEAAPDNGLELEKTVNEVKKIVQNYHLALDRRQHGGVAAGKAIKRLETLLGMYWQQGQMTEYLEKHPKLVPFYDKPE